MAFAYQQYRTGTYCHEHWATTGYPLLSNKFNVTVNDTNVSTELVQLYQCTSTVPREVIYLFEVPPNAAVTGFTAQVGTNNIEADIRSKSEATTIYNAAKAGNTQTYKLDQVANDMFQISLGTVSAGMIMTLTVRYVQYVTSDTLDDSVRLVIPMTYGVTRAGTNPTFPAGWNGLAVPGAVTGNNAVEVNMRIRMGRQVMSLRSPTHTGLKTDIGFEYDAHLLPPRDRERDQDLTRAWAQWISPTYPDKDLIITWQSAELDEPRAVMQRRTINGRTTYAFQLSLVSPVDFGVADGADFTFMLDGAAAAPVNTTIKEAFNTMTNFLPARPRVTVYKFSTNASIMVNRTTLDTSTGPTVRNTVSTQLTPSGTKNMARSLSDVINARDKTTSESNIVIISDCQDWGVTDTVKTITTAIQQAGSQLLRFFVFAVGDRVSNDMAESIARAGLGGVVYAIDSRVDDLAFKARRLIRTVGRLPIQVRDVEWPFDPEPVAQPTGSGGWGAKQDNDDGLGLQDKRNNVPPAPPMDKTPRPGNLLWSVRSTWNAIARGTPRAQLRVTVRYRAPADTTDRTQQFRVNNLGDYTPVSVDMHVLSAKALAQAAQDQLIVTTSGDTKYDLEGTIERLGLTYRFATTQTSFIATTTGVGQVIQPINFNNRSLGVSGANANLSSLQVSVPAAAPQFKAMQFTGNSSFSPPVGQFMRMAVSSFGAPEKRDLPMMNPEPVAPNTNVDTEAIKDNAEEEPQEVTIDSLLAMRTAQGGFPPNLITRDMFGGDLPPLPTGISSLNGDAFQKSEIWVALLVAAYVKMRLPNSRKREDVEASAKKFFVTTLDCCFGLKEVERYNLLSSTLLDAEDAIP